MILVYILRYWYDIFDIIEIKRWYLNYIDNLKKMRENDDETFHKLKHEISVNESGEE